jgi:hypothetical protein
MTPFDKAATEVAHWGAAVPLALMFLLRVSGRKFPAVFWIVAIAFAVSFIADTVRKVTGVPFIARPYYPPIQFALFALAVSIGRRWLGDAVALLAVSAVIASPLLLAGLDVWVRGLGAVIVLGLMALHETPLVWTLIVYCGFATAFWLWMQQYGTDYYAARPWWYAYQGARLAAFGLFARAAWRANE